MVEDNDAQSNREYLFCMTAIETWSPPLFFEWASVVCDSALCIDNLCSGGTCEALWRFTVTFRPAEPQLSTQTQSPSCWHLMGTHSNQSTATIIPMSSPGSPTNASTITMVTRPAWRMTAALMLAVVAVIQCRWESGGVIWRWWRWGL